MEDDWSNFLEPYDQAVNELKLKLRTLRGQFKKSGNRSPIEYVTGRVKPIPSILEKMKRRKIQPKRLSQDMEDIAGIRIMCQFVEDIYRVVELLRKRKDMQVIEERDYIKTPKESGYRSYHLVVMYQGCIPPEVAMRLETSAEIAFALDQEMSSIREEVNEAQRLFEDKHTRLE